MHGAVDQTATVIIHRVIGDTVAVITVIGAPLSVSAVVHFPREGVFASECVKVTQYLSGACDRERTVGPYPTVHTGETNQLFFI